MKMESQADDWNRVNIAAPPFTTLAYSWNEDSEVLCNYLPIWKESFSCLNTFYNKGQYFNFLNECRILDGLTLFHKRHRKEKFYNLLLKIRKCVRRLNKGQIFGTVSKILQMVPVSEKRGGNVRLPTRQLFEYLLIRIFGIFQLLLTIDHLCLAVGKILIGNLKRGYDYKAALGFLPAVARVRVLALYYAEHLAYFYDEVFPTLQYLKGSPRFSFSHSSSLSQELIDHCLYEKDEDTRSVTSQKIESGVLDVFVESKEMPLEVSDILSRFGEKFGFKVCSDDDMDDSSSDESHNTNYLKNESGFTPKVEVSKKVMGLSEPQTKKELKLSEKEKDLISLLDILNDNLDENTTESTLNSHEYNEKSECKTKSSLHVDSLKRSEDLGEIVDINETGNKKKKDKQKKKKISECEVSGENVVEEGKSVKKKKKLLHQSCSVATDGELSKMTVNDKDEKVESNFSLKKKKRKHDTVNDEDEKAESNFSPKKKKCKHDKGHDCLVSLAENERRIVKNKKHKSQSEAEDGDRVQNRLEDWGIATESNVSQNNLESTEVRKKEKSSFHMKKDKKKKCKQMDDQSILVCVPNELSIDSVIVNKDKTVKKKKKRFICE